jgi:hypothetical protein
LENAGANDCTIDAHMVGEQSDQDVGLLTKERVLATSSITWMSSLILARFHRHLEVSGTCAWKADVRPFADPRPAQATASPSESPEARGSIAAAEAIRGLRPFFQAVLDRATYCLRTVELGKPIQQRLSQSLCGVDQIDVAGAGGPFIFLIGDFLLRPGPNGMETIHDRARSAAQASQGFASSFKRAALFADTVSLAEAQARLDALKAAVAALDGVAP